MTRSRFTAVGLLLALLALGLFWRAGAFSRNSSPEPLSPGESDAPADERRSAVELGDGDGARESLSSPETRASELLESEAPAGTGSPLLAGELEVLVMLGDSPANAGWVHLTSGPRSWLPADPWRDGGEVLRRPIGADGRALFRGLSAGRVVVGAEVRPGFVHQRSVELPVGEGARVLITLGRGRLFGHVFDSEGTPIAGARIGLWSRVHESTAATWSDERGYYELRELAAGFFFVGVDYSGRQNAGGGDLNLQLTLEEGESRELDFGRPVALPRWSGQVRTRSGSVVPNRPGGVMRAGALHLLRLADKDYARHEFEQDGSFSVALEPGSYRVHISAPSSDERHLLFESLVVEERGLVRDVVLPGTRVRGVVYAAGEAHAPSGGVEVSVSLYRDVQSAPTYSGETRPDGSYCLDGVQPGSYTVKTWRRRIPDGVLVEVAEQPSEVTLDLHLLP